MFQVFALNEQMAKLWQKVSQPLRDARDIFFRRRSARINNQPSALWWAQMTALIIVTSTE
jgi:hypothetical protein